MGKNEQINNLDNWVDLIDYMAQGGFSRSWKEREELEKQGKVIKSKIGKYIIDSCWTWDCGYETAIWYKGCYMVIVERYDNEDDMKKGHDKWCEFCKTKPKEVYSVQTHKIESLMRERV